MPRKALTHDLASATVRYLRINADQTTSELTAAQMLAALGRVAQVRTANLVRATVTLANDTAFAIAVGAGETWHIVYDLFVLEGNGAGIKCYLTWPASSEAEGAGIFFDENGAVAATALLVSDPTTQPAEVLIAGSAATWRHIHYTLVLTTTSAGTVNLQWACGAAFDVTMLKGSTVQATKL